MLDIISLTALIAGPALVAILLSIVLIITIKNGSAKADLQWANRYARRQINYYTAR